ncbi:MAG: hypothetical protein WB646_20495 [Steroidobacteraceae bacterium]
MTSDVTTDMPTLPPMFRAITNRDAAALFGCFDSVAVVATLMGANRKPMPMVTAMRFCSVLFCSGAPSSPEASLPLFSVTGFAPRVSGSIESMRQPPEQKIADRCAHKAGIAQ